MGTLSPVALNAMQQLSGPTRAISEFERMGLMNRAVIDAVAVDVPLVTMANNKTDRWERFVRQALVLLIGFVAAPLHAKLLSKHFSKQIGFEKQTGATGKQLDEALFRLSFKDLETEKSMQNGLQRLYGQELKIPLPTINEKMTEALRKSVVASKSKFLMADLALLCTLFSGVGFIRVLAGKIKTGKDQFSGEMGVISQDKLDKLYQQESGKRKISKHVKEAATLGLGLTLPIGLGLTFKKHYQNPDATGFISKLAPKFDYIYPRTTRFLQGWPMMSVAGLVLSSLILTVGELAAARSKREFKTTAIQRNSIDSLFFFGTPLFMTVFNGGAHSIQHALEKKAKLTSDPALLKKTANRSAVAFAASFILNMLAVAGIVTYTNRLTKTQVKNAGDALNTTSGALVKPDNGLQKPVEFWQNPRGFSVPQNQPA